MNNQQIRPIEHIETLYHRAGEQMYVTPETLSFQRGDFILVKGKSTDFFDSLIRFGQRLRHKKYWDYTHAAYIVDSMGHLIEATPKGVIASSLEKYEAFDYAIIKIMASDEDRANAVYFASLLQNDGYGWTTIVSIALSLLTGLKFSFGFDGEEICSGLVASCLFMCGQWLGRDPSHITPSDLAQAYIG